jgi:hypothetical protein
MKKKYIYLFLAVFCLFPIAGSLVNKEYHKKVKSSPMRYVYQTYYGPPNPVLVIDNLKLKDSLISYYDNIRRDPHGSHIFNFPLKTLPLYEPVYVVDFTDDSLLAEVVSYYNRGHFFGGSYLRCWVDSRTLHEFPPNRR